MRNLTNQSSQHGPDQFGVQVARPAKQGPETHSWYFHPSRVDVRFAPQSFMRLVKELEITPEIQITWNPIREFYQVWQRNPKLQHPICQGWKLLFNVAEGDKYCPLDERVMWKLYDRSIQLNPANGGSLKRYFDRVEAQMKADEVAVAKARDNDRRDRTDPWFEFGKIKVSGCGASNGSKFSTYLQ